MPTCPKVTRLKYICELIVDCEHKTAPTQETGYPLIRTPNIGLGHLILNGVNRVSEEIYQEWSRRTIPQTEDLILAREAPVGNVAIIPKNMKVCLGQRTVLIRPDKNKTCSTFLVYLMLGDDAQARLLERSTGSTVHHLNMTDIRNLELPTLPPLPVQTRIADFLDRKTGQIDELIHIKERRIELLQEQRTALINQAVTKGLDPNVEMKPSGVEWIGEMPKHWTVTRLKYLGESIIGLSYKPEDVTDEENGTLVLRASNIQDGKPSFLDNVYVNAEIDEKLRLKEGDILICSRSGSRDLIGKNMTITKELEGITFGVFMTVFRTKFVRFISYFLNSQIFKNQSGLFLTSTINQLTINTLNNFLICFPTDEGEQAQIAAFLNRKTGQIDELISAEQRKIELLKEYRQSLISEVVTGKIDVRNEV